MRAAKQRPDPSVKTRKVSYHVIETFHVLDIDSGLEQFPHILIPFGVAASRDIGAGQFIHENECWVSTQCHIQIKLTQFHFAMGCLQLAYVFPTPAVLAENEQNPSDFN